MVMHPAARLGIRIPWTNLNAIEQVVARNRHELSRWAPAANDPEVLEIADGAQEEAADWWISACRSCSGRALAGRNGTWVDGLLLHTCGGQLSQLGSTARRREGLPVRQASRYLAGATLAD